jgi:hypothetical protein
VPSHLLDSPDPLALRTPGMQATLLVMQEAINGHGAVGRGRVSLLMILDTWHSKHVMDIVDL